MKLLVETLRELLGLFVEDLSLTIGIVIALAVGGAAVTRLGLDHRWNGGVLFLLLAVVLIENVRRSSRQ